MKKMKKMFLVCILCALPLQAQTSLALDDAIAGTVQEIGDSLQNGSRIALVNFDSESAKISDYIMEELTLKFEEASIEVADRNNLSTILNDLHIRDKNNLSQNEQQQIAKYVAADIIVTGQFINIGNTYRFRATAIAKNAQRLNGARFDVNNDHALNTMLDDVKNDRLAGRHPRLITDTQIKSAGRWLDEGIRLESEKRLNEALNAVNEAIKINPSFSAAYLQRGKYLFASASSIIGNSDDSFNIDYLGFLNSGSIKKENIRKALSDFTKTLNLDPQLFVAYAWRGMASTGLGEYDNAIADYTQFISYNSRTPSVYTNRGNAYLAKNEYTIAMLDYNEAIRLNPNYDLAYYNRGRAYLKTENYQSALSDFSESIKLNPYNALAYFNRGNIYFLQDEYNMAIQDYNQVVRIKPDYPEAYMMRGNTQCLKEDYDRAIPDFDEAISLNPNYALAYQLRGLSYAMKKNNKKAIADLNQSLRLDPSLSKSRELLEAIR
jgi:tetratricopeptide (TPR) repeat protein